MWNETSLFTAAVVLALVLPAIVVLKRLWREHRAAVVTVEVTEIEEEPDPSGIKAKSRYYPILTILDGPHRGAAWRSKQPCDPAATRLGDQLEAKYFPETGEIDARQRNWQDWLPLFAPFVFLLGLALLSK